MSPALLPLHMGALHPYEQALTLVLAFGPFVLLALVIYLRKRHDARSPETGERESQREAQRGSERDR